MEERATGTSGIGVSAPFNSAIDCLMRISNLITKISRVSVEYILYTDITGVSLSAGQAQHIKSRLVKQLFVQAYPLLKDAAKAEIRAMIDKVKPITKETVVNRTGKMVRKFEDFSVELDLALDEIVMSIEQDLQKSHYFMPPHDDPRRAVLN